MLNRFFIILIVILAQFSVFSFALAETKKTIVLSVPFTSQSPYGEWKDARQQDACEEASVIMAVYWARGKSLDKKIAKREILAMSDWEKKKYDNFTDTSASSTAERLFIEYYKYKKVEVKYNFEIKDIIKELEKGNVIIVPTNGRLLKNPNFTAPGPDRHNVLIRGYDYAKKQFITNDPGTRKGEAYRYGEKVLFKAIRDYPTGKHLPIKKDIKAMIVVSK